MLRRTLFLVMAVATVAVGVSTTRRASALSKLEDARLQLIRQEARLDMERNHVHELTRILLRHRLERSDLVGDMVPPSTGLLHSPRMPRLVVVLSPTCAACERALPLLDSLEKELPGSVVGVTFGVPRADVMQYSQRFRVQFPILVSPTGAVSDVLPRHATPVFVLYDGVQLRSIDIGIMPKHRVARVHELLTQVSQAQRLGEWGDAYSASPTTRSGTSEQEGMRGAR
jgi:thiol-disulfide isomerase/thioredoxin